MGKTGLKVLYSLVMPLTFKAVFNCSAIFPGCSNVSPVELQCGRLGMHLQLPSGCLTMSPRPLAEVTPVTITAQDLQKDGI